MQGSDQVFVNRKYCPRRRPKIDDHQRSTIEIVIWRPFKINRPLAMTPWLGNEGNEVYIDGISKTIKMFAKVGKKAQIRSSGTIGLARVEITRTTSSDGDGSKNMHGSEFCLNKLRTVWLEEKGLRSKR